MKLKIPSILMLCVMCAVLLSGCTITISPASPGTSSDTAVQSRPETEETPSSGDLATPAPTASPQVAQSTEVPAESSAISSADGTSSDEKHLLLHPVQKRGTKIQPNQQQPQQIMKHRNQMMTLSIMNRWKISQS